MNKLYSRLQNLGLIRIPAIRTRRYSATAAANPARIRPWLAVQCTDSIVPNNNIGWWRLRANSIIAGRSLPCAQRRYAAQRRIDFERLDRLVVSRSAVKFYGAQPRAGHISPKFRTPRWRPVWEGWLCVLC